MRNKLLIISMPFKIGIGGFLRSYYVLPRLAKLLAESDYELSLYVPANAIRAFIIVSLNKSRREVENNDYQDVVDELFQIIIDELKIVEKESNYAFTIDEKILKKNLEYNRILLLKELKQNSPLNFIFVSENLRPLLIHFFEKNFVNMIRNYIEKPHYGYSMHETSDAITALTLLSSNETKTTVMLQSDLGKRFIEKVININMFKALSKNTKFCGILSVSPAPIVESPWLFKLRKTAKILVPGVAIDPGLAEEIHKMTKFRKIKAVVYYGRISKEKGIFDLLKAWNIVQKKTDVHLYIFGLFSDYSTKMKFNKTIEKHNLKTVKYLGYQERNKLFRFISTLSVLAYPSYRDSFSLTVLEALLMGLRVVAYDIPALHFLYQKSSNVELVPIGNVKKLAFTIINNLEKPFERDCNTIRILRNYSSWEKVAIEEHINLSKIFESNTGTLIST